jgi:hypothetical protein
LLALADIEARIGPQDIPGSERATEPTQVLTLIQEAIISHDDIQAIPDNFGGAWYFSERFMTAAYARILLLRSEGPLKMQVENP